MRVRTERPADEIIEGHEGFHGSLADATCAALHLAYDPQNGDAAGQAHEARDFIQHHALPHMEYEEAILFPRAIARGVPPLCIEVLRDEHDALRRIASLILDEQVDGVRAPLPLGNEQAMLLLLLIQMFEKHAAREEAVLLWFPTRVTAN